MSLQTIQRKIASAYERLAVKNGKTCTYSIRGESAQTIYVYFGTRDMAVVDEMGLRIDEETVAITIPYQSGCTGTPPADALITLSSDYYTVASSVQLGHGPTPVGWQVIARKNPRLNKAY